MGVSPERNSHKRSSVTEKRRLCQKHKKNESLNPFLNQNLIRPIVRLRHANLSFGENHPIILPHSHPAVDLYIQFQLKHNHHQGVEHIRAEFQTKLWVTGLRNALSLVKHQCLH